MATQVTALRNLTQYRMRSPSAAGVGSIPTRPRP
jgi:hypothetical protein